MGFYWKAHIEPHTHFTSGVGTDTSTASRCCFFTSEEGPDTNLKGEVLWAPDLLPNIPLLNTEAYSSRPQLQIILRYHGSRKGKGKAVPLQARRGQGVPGS